MNVQPIPDPNDPEPPPTKAEVETLIAELLSQLRAVNPLELIGQTTFFHHQAPDEISDGGITRSEAQVEYLVSLATARTFPSNAPKSNPDAIDACLNQLNRTYRRAAHFHSADTTRLSLTEGRLVNQLRMGKLFHRGLAARVHLDRLYWDVAPTHDEFLRRYYGFDAAQLQEVIRWAGETQQAEYNRRRAAFLSIYQPLQAEAAKLLGVPVTESGLWQRWLSAPELKDFRQAHIAEIQQHFDAIDAMAAPAAYEIMPRNEHDRRVLAPISLSFGENRAFLEELPAWRGWPLNSSLIHQKPVTAHDGHYYLFLRPLLIRGALDIVEGLIRSADPNYWQHTFLPRRDRYVEDTAIELVGTVLPDADCFAGARYDCVEDGIHKRVEVDGIFVWDDCLLIVEAKATGLADASRRGARGSLASDYKESIGAAYGQGKRLLTTLRANAEVPLYCETGIELTRLRHADFRHVFLVSVTRDTFGVAATQLAAIREVGLLPGDDWPWAIDLLALRAVSELLPLPAVFLHYVVRRIAINLQSKLVALDEYDLLGLFLASDLTIPEGAADGFGIVIPWNSASDINEYYNAVERGDPAAKPKYPLAGRAAALLAALAREKPTHFASTSLRILEALAVNRTALENFVTEAERAFKRRNVSQLAVFGNKHDLPRRSFALGTSLLTPADRALLLARAEAHKARLKLSHLTVILWRPPIKGAWIEIHEI